MTTQQSVLNKARQDKFILGGSMPLIDPSRTFNDEQWGAYERLFG